MKTIITIIILVICGAIYWGIAKSDCADKAKIYADLGGPSASIDNLQNAYNLKYQECMNSKGF